MNEKGLIIIYNSKNNTINVEVKLIDENMWLTQDQIVQLFESSKANISEHIKNILSEGELKVEATVRNFRIVQNEGTREVSRNIRHYNLEMIIAIGYRVKSNIGTNFRIWATEKLSEYYGKNKTTAAREQPLFEH